MAFHVRGRVQRAVEDERWRASLHDGWASAWRGGDEQPVPLRGLRASIDGDVLRLAVAIEQVRGTLRLGRPSRWTVSVWSHAIGGELGDVWIDDLPADQQFAPGTGVLHRP